MPAQTSPGLAMGTPKTPLSHYGRLLLAFGLPPIPYQLGKAAWDERHPASPAAGGYDLTFASYDWTAPPLPSLDTPTRAAVILTTMFVTLAVAWTVSLALERLSLDVRGADPRLRPYEWGLIAIWSLFVVPAALQPGLQGVLLAVLGA